MEIIGQLTAKYYLLKTMPQSPYVIAQACTVSFVEIHYVLSYNSKFEYLFLLQSAKLRNR